MGWVAPLHVESCPTREQTRCPLRWQVEAYLPGKSPVLHGALVSYVVSSAFVSCFCRFLDLWSSQATTSLLCSHMGIASVLQGPLSKEVCLAVFLPVSLHVCLNLSPVLTLGPFPFTSPVWRLFTVGSVLLSLSPCTPEGISKWLDRLSGQSPYCPPTVGFDRFFQ